MIQADHFSVEVLLIRMNGIWLVLLVMAKVVPDQTNQVFTQELLCTLTGSWWNNKWYWLTDRNNNVLAIDAYGAVHYAYRNLNDAVSFFLLYLMLVLWLITFQKRWNCWLLGRRRWVTMWIKKFSRWYAWGWTKCHRWSGTKWWC